MEIMLLCVGRTDKKCLIDFIDLYEKRINHYIKFKIKIISEVKTKKKKYTPFQKDREGALIKSKLKPTDIAVLLNENGKQLSSVAFADFIEKKMLARCRRLVFIIGGPFGFAEQMFSKHEEKIALSKMTFSHQMVRLFFCEQLYRAFTILNNHPYHND